METKNLVQKFNQEFLELINKSSEEVKNKYKNLIATNRNQFGECLIGFIEYSKYKKNIITPEQYLRIMMFIKTNY